MSCNFIWRAAAEQLFRTHGSFWTRCEESTVKRQKSFAASQSPSLMPRGTRTLSKRNQRKRFRRIKEKFTRSLHTIVIIPKRMPWPGKSSPPAPASVRSQRTTMHPQSPPRITEPAQARIQTQGRRLTPPSLATFKSRQHRRPRKKIYLIRLT